MAHLWGSYMRHPLLVKNLINVFRYRILTTDTPCLVCRAIHGVIDVLHPYMVLTTDTPWLDRKGDTWDVPCEFKVGLMYCITTGSSPQTSHCSSVRAIYGVTPVGSNSGRCITSLQGPHNRNPMARPQSQYMWCPPWFKFWLIYIYISQQDLHNWQPTART